MKFGHRWLMAAALCVVALGLSGCKGERWSWHQKLTVTVEAPDGEVSGSSVVEVFWREKNSVFVYPAGHSGEASVVDLGGGRYLFALLSEQTKYLAFNTFNGGPGIGEEIFAEMAKFRGVKSAPPKYYPMLVTFDDITKPETVKKVDPNNLAATFGAGYALKSLMLEITDEPVTTGAVEKVLGSGFFKKWGSVHNEALGRGLKDPYFKSFMSELKRSDFVRNSK